MSSATDDSSNAALPDDASVADSVSSVGPDGWEAVDRLALDDDSDALAESYSHIAPGPAVDDLSQSTILTPPESVLEVVGDDASDLDEAETPMAATHQEPDVSMLWDSKPITFPESDTAADVATEQDLTCPLAEIAGKTASQYLRDSSWSNLDNVIGSLKMRLGPRPVVLGRPLRLFFVGSTEAQNELEAKIGSALIAGQGDNIPRGRRRSILPISLSKSCPEVELVPDFGANMEIETFVKATRLEDKHTEAIEFTMDSGTTFRSYFDHQLKNYVVDDAAVPPDLAIVHVPENEDEKYSLLLRARTFLNRHSVPTIIVTSDRTWQVPLRPLTIDLRSPHFVVHVPGTSMSGSTLLKRIPIDVDTFLQLDSLQLNRSMACMLSTSLQHTKKVSSSRMSLSGVLASNDTSDQILSTISRSIGILCALIALLAVVVPMAAPTAIHQRTAAGSPDAVSTRISSTAASIATSSVTSVITAQSKGPTTLPEKSVSQLMEHDPQSFGVELISDGLIFLRPPQWYVDNKRPPKLEFVVSKDGVALDHSSLQLSDTRYYTISIPPESAYGEINIEIAWKNRGKCLERYEMRVDLGSPYWRIFYRQKSPSEMIQQTMRGLGKESQPRTDAKQDEPDHEPRDRLAEDVKALASEVSRVGKRIGQTIHDSLISIHNQRQKTRKMKRQSRREVIDSMTDRIRDWAASVQENVNEFKRTHYRKEQKDLLKLWWRISGGPPGRHDKNGRQNRPVRSKRSAR